MRLTIGRVETVDVRGTTHAADPTLGGTVLVDELRAFSGTSPSGPVSGRMQDRVVRQADGKLAFYYRIYELRGDNIDYIAVTQFTQAGYPNLDVDFRTDGLGVIGPYRVSTDGANIKFEFAATRPISPSELSRFMYIRPATGATNYQSGAVVILGTQRWATTFGGCFRPVWG
jgi:hypothetical protein